MVGTESVSTTVAATNAIVAHGLRKKKTNQQNKNIMEENLVKCLKAFADIMCSDEVLAEDIVDKFLEKAELALSPEAREDLINHIDNLYKFE